MVKNGTWNARVPNARHASDVHSVNGALFRT